MDIVQYQLVYIPLETSYMRQTSTITHKSSKITSKTSTITHQPSKNTSKISTITHQASKNTSQISTENKNPVKIRVKSVQKTPASKNASQTSTITHLT